MIEECMGPAYESVTPGSARKRPPPLGPFARDTANEICEMPGRAAMVGGRRTLAYRAPGAGSEPAPGGNNGRHSYLCAAAGGPLYYVGRDMKTSHRGMGIAERDWQIFLGHVTATLDHFKVPPIEKSEVLGFVESLKKDVVE
jgi:Bacterial-like globin